MSSFISWATRTSLSSAPIRWCVQWGIVNGKQVNVEAIARTAALKFLDYKNVKPHQVTCTAKADGNGIDVSSLKVWLNTETHGKWAMNKTTQAVKDILCQKYGAEIPWFKR